MDFVTFHLSHGDRGSQRENPEPIPDFLSSCVTGSVTSVSGLPIVGKLTGF